MIVFDLRCLSGCAIFEAWFSSSADFAAQSERGLVECPFCGSAEVEKAPMAPRVSRAGASATPGPVEALAALQQELLSQSEWVGDDLPQTARAMHLGEVEQRPVHGRASAADARSLIEDGVPVLPLPFPVVPPGQVN